MAGTYAGGATGMAKTRAWTADGSASAELGTFPKRAPGLASTTDRAAAQRTPPAPIMSRTLLGRDEPVAILHGAPGSSFVAVDPREVATRARELVGDLARAKAVDVVIRCTCSRMWVEPQAFSEALYELLENAVRATRARHPVTIDVRDTAGGDVLWRVQDAGEGMTAETLTQLGEPFPAARPGVLCLGVALARAIVEAHGGLLRFESAPGVGTTASIWLPGARDSDMPKAPAAPEGAD
jgi:hypothetical protein